MIGTVDGYWFSYDPDTMLLTVHQYQTELDIIKNVAEDEVGTTFDEFIHSHRQTRIQ